jgi:hypothetical protein
MGDRDTLSQGESPSTEDSLAAYRIKLYKALRRLSDDGPSAEPPPPRRRTEGVHGRGKGYKLPASF